MFLKLFEMLTFHYHFGKNRYGVSILRTSARDSFSHCFKKLSGFSSDSYYIHGRRIQQNIHHMVIQKIDFIHIQNPPVAPRKQAV
jgi:hypothetical protein